MARACVLTEYGPPDVLEWKDVPTPEPSAGQIRIKVRVSGVSPTDLKIRHGDVKEIFALAEPPVLGFETAGIVNAVGDEASGVAVGDEVATAPHCSEGSHRPIPPLSSLADGNMCSASSTPPTT